MLKIDAEITETAITKKHKTEDGQQSCATNDDISLIEECSTYGMLVNST